MIDMHTHILPGVDDGADTMETAIEMICKSVENSTNEILLTPHGNLQGLYENFNISSIKNCYIRLQEELIKRKIEAKLHLGMEVFGTYDIDEKIQNHDILPIGKSKYILVEFNFEEEPEDMFFILEKICEQGLQPIIAHPERYTAVKNDPTIVYEWNRRNYGVQINKGSLAGRFGKREEYIAFLLLDANLVQIIASDCHDVFERKPGLKNIYTYISENYSEGYAELLMEINPKRVLENKKILIINPKRI